MHGRAAPHRLLVLFAHPALQKSRVNRAMLRTVRDLPGITIHDLYDAYPDFDIDVPREQQLLTEHDILVLHHPFYWYSSPAIIKEWEDLVLTHGWAYGHTGRALHGKQLLSVITTGGGEDAYQKGGHNRFTIRELLAPIEQTARLCGMEYLPPFAVHGTHSFTPHDIERHASDYRRTLVALRDGAVDLETARSHPRLNTDLDSILPR
jgi:glutathione-regulated potassium-efflux system ancillary protein KefG